VTLARISKRAQQDLRQIREYIALDDPEAAERVEKALLDTADLLAQNIEIGRRIPNAAPRHTDVRWFVVPRFRNYLIFLQTTSGEHSGYSDSSRGARLDSVLWSDAAGRIILK